MTTEKAIEIIEHHQAWRTGSDMPMIHPKQLTEALNVVLKIAKFEDRKEALIIQGQLIDDRYLMEMHPELSTKEALEYLKFCNDNAIHYKICYGKGQIMYPMWMESKQSKP